MAETTGEEKSLATHVTELYELVLAYAKQETVEPVKGLVRFIGFGIAGSLAFGIGSVIMLLGGLRALQTETGSAFQGNWSWAPYGITAVGCAVVIALAFAIRARRPNRGGPRP
jgi:ascorbate-specific PTS system EIIC-type component UlaA